MLAKKKVTVVLPAYNAAQTLKQTYDEIPHDIVDDIILTDDASEDLTVEMARGLGIATIRHDRNRGYGSNQKTCYTAALARGRRYCRDAASGLPVHAEAGNRDGVDDRLGGV
jgi:glycosyltransferase involved in cell wall biosynthesis